ncbi:MAG TPA: PspC domain-containing protein [Marmoricola sp.]|nr:PspC domain-containing protein [Marmoricola sp.]
MTETDMRPDDGRPDTGTQEGPRVSHEEMRDLARLRRSRTDRYFGGVAGGLARHFDIDPTVVRVIFVVTTFFGGAGLLAYAALWLVVPEEGSDQAVLHARADARRTLVVIIAALAVLVLLGNAWGGAWRGVWHVSWLLVAIALVALLVLNRDRRHAAGPRSSAPRQPGAPAATYGDTATASAPAAEQPAVGASAPLPWEPPVPPPARRRRTGPVWFWPTLALIAIGLGTLALIDRPLPAGSYAALALAIIGAMLLLGAFVGRGGGLVALGILATIALVASTTAGRIGFDGHAQDMIRVPVTATAVQSSYHVDAGRIMLDLSQVSDPGALDGRTVAVSANAGDIEVTVPRGVDVVVNADISYVGGIHVDGQSREGGSPSLHTVIDGGNGVPELTLDLHERVGQIKVVQEGAFQ